jgi:hypothetical protein
MLEFMKLGFKQIAFGGDDSGGGGSGSDDSNNPSNYFDDRDGDGVSNIFDFDDGVGWADTSAPDTGGGSDDNDGPTFGEAFAAARAQQGPGGTFTWNGQVYTTNTAEEEQAAADAQAEANRKALLEAQMEADRRARAASEAAAVEADRIAKEEAAARMEAEAEAAAAEQERLRLEEAAASFEEEAAADDAQRVTLPPSGGGITDIPVEDLLPPPPAYEGPTEDGTAGYEQDTSRSVVDPVSGNIVAVFPTTPDSDLANRYIEGYQQGFRDEDLETFVDESYGISPPATDPYQLPELVLDAELPVDEFTGLPPSMTDPNYIAPEPPPATPSTEGLTDDQAMLYGDVIEQWNSAPDRSNTQTATLINDIWFNVTGGGAEELSLSLRGIGTTLDELAELMVNAPDRAARQLAQVMDPWSQYTLPTGETVDPIMDLLGYGQGQIDPTLAKLASEAKEEFYDTNLMTERQVSLFSDLAKNYGGQQLSDLSERQLNQISADMQRRQEEALPAAGTTMADIIAGRAVDRLGRPYGTDWLATGMTGTQEVGDIVLDLALSALGPLGLVAVGITSGGAGLQAAVDEVTGKVDAALADGALQQTQEYKDMLEIYGTEADARAALIDRATEVAIPTAGLTAAVGDMLVTGAVRGVVPGTNTFVGKIATSALAGGTTESIEQVSTNYAANTTGLDIPLDYDTGSSFLQGLVGDTVGSTVGAGVNSFQNTLSKGDMQSLVDNSGVQGTQKNALDAFVNSGDNFTSQANSDGTITVTNDDTGATITVSTGQGGVDVMDQLANGVDNIQVDSVGNKTVLTNLDTGDRWEANSDDLTFKDVLDFSNGINPNTGQAAPPPADDTTVTQPLTSQDVTRIVDEAFASNPALSAEDVGQIVRDTLAAEPTLTADEVEAIVRDAFMEDTRITAADVETIVNTAMGGLNLLTPDDVTSAIRAEIDNLEFATPDAVQQIVNDALANNPSLTGDQVQQIVNDALAGQDILSPEQVQSIVDSSLGNLNLLTSADVTAAIQQEISQLEFATPDAVRQIVSDALAGQQNLSPEQVQQIVNNAVSNLPNITTTDVTNIVNDALSAQAPQFENIRTELDTRIQELIDSGATAQEATNAALTELSTELGTTNQNLLDQIGATEQSIMERVGSQISDVETSLLNRIGELQNAGQTADEALNTALSELEISLGTTRQDLLGTIGETEQSILSQVGGRISDIETSLLNRIGELQNAGQTADEALNTALSELEISLGTTRQDLLGRLAKLSSPSCLRLAGGFLTLRRLCSTVLGNSRMRVKLRTRPLTQPCPNWRSASGRPVRTCLGRLVRLSSPSCLRLALRFPVSKPRSATLRPRLTAVSKSLSKPGSIRKRPLMRLSTPLQVTSGRPVRSC